MSNKNIQVTIDGILTEVNANTTVYQACDSLGIEVPCFCFHERLAIAGNCRMCLVEIEKMPKPVTSCTLPVSPGLKVYTQTPLVKKARESVLEFILANHPLDCPVCDQGGECDLQDLSYLSGNDYSRFSGPKRTLEDTNKGPIIKTIMTRCINCTRCVRFATDVAGIESLGVTGRGNHAEIGTYIKKMIDSEISGNLIDLCPVGALTSKSYAFSYRSWELKPVKSIDVLDGFGSNITLYTKKTEIVRILPRLNESINEEWITDKARFFYQNLLVQRLTIPLIKNNGNSFLKSNWKEIKKSLNNKFIKYSINNNNKKKLKQISYKIALGSKIDLETITLSKNFLNKRGSSNLYYQKKYLNNNDIFKKIPLNFGLTGEKNCVILINTNPTFTGSSLHLRLRRAVLEGKLTVYVIGLYCDLNYSNNYLGSNSRILKNVLEGNHILSKKIFNYKNLTIIKDKSNLKVDLLISEMEKNLFNFSILNSFNLTPNSTLVNLNYINSSNNTFKNKNNKNDFLILLDVNENINNFKNIINNNKSSIIIYIGYQGNNLSKICDFILPSSAITEMNSHFINILGMTQKANFAISSPGLAQSRITLFNYLLKI